MEFHNPPTDNFDDSPTHTAAPICDSFLWKDAL